jgi:hypothetical protein
MGTYRADVQSPVESDDISNQHCRYESNEKNERSLSATSVDDAPQRHMKTVATWAAGVARLAALAPHPNYPQHAWQQLIVDAERFLDHWAPQAAALGWPTWELFGCHRQAPFGRIQGMGLVLLLRGDDIAALTATEALIRTQTGARQTYRRKSSDPLHPAERCLIWELA